MKKDEVWERLKRDKTTVYGKPILDMFVSMTHEMEDRHWRDLPAEKRERARPQMRLDRAETVEEADAAMRDGAAGLEIAARNAARRGDEVMAMHMVSKGASVYSVLTGAARGGRMELLRWAGGRVGPPTGLRWSLLDAVEGGSLEAVRYMLELIRSRGGGRVESQFLDDALNRAARRGHLPVARHLVGEGARCGRVTIEDAMRSGRPEVLEYLLGSSPNYMGWAMTAAVVRGRRDFVDLILGMGGRVKREDLPLSKDPAIRGYIAGLLGSGG